MTLNKNMIGIILLVVVLVAVAVITSKNKSVSEVVPVAPVAEVPVAEVPAGVTVNTDGVAVTTPVAPVEAPKTAE